jgi:hypothetical protein
LRTGRSDGDWIEVLEGLEEGDRVVWDGHFALDDGSSVVVDAGSSPGVASNLGADGTNDTSNSVSSASSDIQKGDTKNAEVSRVAIELAE